MLAECPEMFLLSKDFLIICMPTVEALETVDADGEDRVGAEVTGTAETRFVTSQ